LSPRAKARGILFYNITPVSILLACHGEAHHPMRVGLFGRALHFVFYVLSHHSS
jgi:hypothetical protein